MPTIHLNRVLKNDRCTIGVLTMPSGWSCFTLENPWRGNRPNISCIPCRRYPILKRWSPRFRKQLFEICNVEGRTHILIHAGNWPENTLGCVLPGLTYRADRPDFVGNSRAALQKITAEIGDQPQWKITVRSSIPVPPST